jgi:hypothetical protein
MYGQRILYFEEVTGSGPQILVFLYIKDLALVFFEFDALLNGELRLTERGTL